jgi:CheY-like chemotaxis protein
MATVTSFAEAPEPAGARPEPRAEWGRRGTPRPIGRILVLEDEAAVEEGAEGPGPVTCTLRASLSQRVDVRSVERFPDAVALLGDLEFDIVLLDLARPADALDALVSLRALAPSIAVVLVTARDADLAARAREAGAHDCLDREQVDGEVLMRSLRYALERKRAAETLTGDRYRRLAEARLPWPAVSDEGGPRLAGSARGGWPRA